MIYYSTLKEAYDIDTFETKKKKKKPKCVDEEEDIVVKGPVTAAEQLYIEPQPTVCIKPPPKNVFMKSVKPFLDEDLEQYLNVENFANAPSGSQATDKTSEKTDKVDPVASSNTKFMPVPHQDVPQVTEKKPEKTLKEEKEQEIFSLEY